MGAEHSSKFFPRELLIVYIKNGQKTVFAAAVEWTRIKPVLDWHALSDGCYLLRSNVNDWTDEQLWKAYIQLTEAENAFRIHKSDLSLRTVWHQKEDRVRAHIFVCFLSYVLWKTKYAGARALATSLVVCLRSYRIFAWSMSCYRLTRDMKSATAASPDHLSTSEFCWTGLA